MLASSHYENKKLMREFYTFYTHPLNLKVVDSSEREETEEERKIRKEELLQEKILKAAEGMLKGKNKNLDKTKRSGQIKNDKDKSHMVDEELEHIKVNEATPNNICLKEDYCLFFKWFASQIQLIKDLQINDCITGQSIWQKIYPQVNGVPVYNQKGLYWVKLYHMGKYRKIEIDDRMPCSKYDELLTPKCENIEELWPAIISKALIKLFSYKYKLTDYFYDNIGDCSIIYALTGYIGETLEVKQFNEGKLNKLIINNAIIYIFTYPLFNIEHISMLKNYLSNDSYFQKKYFVSSFYVTDLIKNLEDYFIKEHLNSRTTSPKKRSFVRAKTKKITIKPTKNDSLKHVVKMLDYRKNTVRHTSAFNITALARAAKSRDTSSTKMPSVEVNAPFMSKMSDIHMINNINNTNPLKPRFKKNELWLDNNKVITEQSEPKISDNVISTKSNEYVNRLMRRNSSKFID